MSVAFRRESDEEHREPRFERPIPPGPNLVTARGAALIEERIVALDRTLAAAGDDAEEAAATRRDLRYWHTRRATAIETAPRVDGIVGFGSTVTLRLAGAARTVVMVGDDEADPAAGLLSFNAPLARAIMGAEAGDLLPFNGRDEAIELVAVG